MSPFALLRRFVLTLILLTASAFAHEPFEITTAARVRTAALEMQVTMARGTAQALLDDGQGEPRAFDPKRFAELKPRLLEAGAHMYRISSDGQALTPANVQVGLTIEDDIEFLLTFPRPAAGRFDLDFPLLKKLPEGYGNALNLTQDNPPAVLSFTLLTASESGVTVTIAPLADTHPASQSITAASSSAPKSPPLFKKFLKLGVEHILTGYDHLLFLAGLLVVARRGRSMLGIITCFTLAHSITLALAALDIVVFPSRVIEPLIAASIVFVGIQNLMTRGEPPHRWALTFAFGLIHGFGFASVLRDLGLGSAGNLIAVPLFAFNLGVEIGQLFVAALILPLMLKLHRTGDIGRKTARVVSVIVVILGGWWLLQRTVLA
jgi:hydrogenase/urease accessory protein HupE